MDIKDSVQHYNGAKEAVQMMLDRPDMLPDMPDKEGKTPLWHALDCVRKEYEAFSSGLGASDGGHFHGFLRSSIEDLCARDDVDPEEPTGVVGKTPLELATELVEICSRDKTRGGSAAHSDGGTDSTTPGDASGREKMRAVVKRLRPVLRGTKSPTKALPPRPPTQTKAMT